MRAEALALEEGPLITVRHDPRAQVVLREEAPTRPVEACILPESLDPALTWAWPAMQFTAQAIQTSITLPDTLTHFPRNCGDVMRHAGRTLPLRVLGLRPPSTRAAPRGMKYPCLAPLIASVYRAYLRSRGRVLLIAGESPLARLLADLLQQAARVHPSPRRQWGRVHGARGEELRGSEWDTLILWSSGGEENLGILDDIAFSRVLVNPLLACNYSLPLRGARGGLLEILWPPRLSDAKYRFLEKKLLKKTKVTEASLDHLPLKPELDASELFVIKLVKS